MMEIMTGIRNSWDKARGHQSMDEAESNYRKRVVLNAIYKAYYQMLPVGPTHVIPIDYSRGWLSHLEMVEAVTGEKAKVLVVVRDLREILASVELLWRNTSKLGVMTQELEFYSDMIDVAGRCAVWTRPNEFVGINFRRIKDALQRGFRDRMHFVHYEQLCVNPAEIVASVHDFIGVDHWEHDFDHIEQVTKEDDRVHHIPGLHDIRHSVEPAVVKQGVLGDVASKYAGPYPWD